MYSKSTAFDNSIVLNQVFEAAFIVHLCVACVMSYCERAIVNVLNAVWISIV